ncbi:type VI secretion system membrane subunit TssM [Aminobacter sp. BE322]|uniref:type VI secretion system membrane subunit TssM n=1 Tax=unclassified Aminobacter TaxID=2644704 RepID=UPI003D20D106
MSARRSPKTRAPANWLMPVISALALAGLAAAVWYAGPLIGFGEARPLGSTWVRLSIVGAAIALLGGYQLFRLLRARDAQRALEAAASRPSDAAGDARALERGMQDAIAKLKRASGRRNFLYEVPWYLVIGPPAVGKTTALVNSGLNFPLAVSGTAQPVPGVGGTRNCDWWFTDNAVLIDTAGRYATQDSDPERDRGDWLAFLSLLKQHRAVQPINGVIVAISLSDLMLAGGQEAEARAIEIRNRLQEIGDTLKISFPVYVMFTKADLIAGFMDYFGDFDERRRQAVWGATFQGADRSRSLPGDVPGEFQALVQRLGEELPDRLQEEADPVSRIAIFGFPAQFASLEQRCAEFIATVFAARNRAGAILRGFYFSSGTQEGTPIDRVLGAMERGLAGAPRPQLSGTGKSFFLHDVLAKVVFGESGWVSFDSSADRRARLGRSLAIGGIVIAALATLGAFGASFKANRDLIHRTEQAAEQYRATADAQLAAATVADADLGTVIDALEAVRNLPVGYETREQPVPAQETLGLSQRERLQSASVSAYRQALERLFRPRLLVHLEQIIAERMNDPAALYEPLKTYLMLGGSAPRTDDEAVVAWLAKDWERNLYPGPQNRDGRVALERHLRAMLALDDAYGPTVALDRQLVEAAQRSLGRMTVADRAAALIQASTSAKAPEDFSVAGRSGPEGPLVFETVDGSNFSGLRIPGIYTYAGFHDVYLEQLSGIAGQLRDDGWVIGAGGEQGDIEQDLLRLGPELLDRYSADFARAWNDVLDRLKFKPLAADKPDYLALSAAGAPNSPLAQLFEAIARETALTRNAPAMDAARIEGLARIGIEVAGQKSANRAGTAAQPGQVLGANIEAQFRPFQLLVDGRPGQRPIDALIQNFRAIQQSLAISAAAPAQAGQANANLRMQISNLGINASRLPKALARMVRAAADEFEGDVASASVAQLDSTLKETVSAACDQAIANRFPFAAGAADEVPIADFARLFAPGGIMDRFFAQNLASLADTSGTDWSWKPDTPIGRGLSVASLKQFQRAAAIRDAFFPLGGSMPSVNLTFTPFSLHTDADMALLDVNGQVVQSYQSGSSAGVVTWPGSLQAGTAHLSLTPELPGRESALKFEGPWALKRLLDAATATPTGEALELRFVIGGRDVAYRLQTNPPGNPFALPAFAEFSCPDGL